MKLMTATRHLAMVFGVAVVLAGSQAMLAQASDQSQSMDQHMGERHGCSLASLHGAFGFTATGSVVGLGPIVRVGREVFDGRGHAHGTATTSVDGTIYTSTFTAIYTVNPDCTGTATENDSQIGTAHDNIVIVNDGRGIQAIGADASEVIGAQWEKQSAD